MVCRGAAVTASLSKPVGEQCKKGSFHFVSAMRWSRQLSESGSGRFTANDAARLGVGEEIPNVLIICFADDG